MPLKIEKLGKKGDSRLEKALLYVRDEPLLSALESGRRDEGVKSEYELELRFLPKRFVNENEFRQDKRYKNFKKYRITQGYVEALDEEGNRTRYRVRAIKSEGREDTFNIARKIRISGRKGKNEHKVESTPGSDDFRDLRYLWETEVTQDEVIEKTRYEVEWKLPNGHMCKIHYDVHHNAALEGLVRIEVEFFQRTADEDERYVREHGIQTCLPDFLGAEVTDIRTFGGAQMSKSYGLIKKGEYQSRYVFDLLTESKRQRQMRETMPNAA